MNTKSLSQIAKTMFFPGIFLMSVLLISCKKNSAEPADPGACDKAVIVSKTLFETAPDDQFYLKDLKINGDCLTIAFQSSGCSGKNWEVELIDRGDLIKTNPSQRTLRLSLKNGEICDALISKEISFNIKKLRSEGTDRVELNVSGKSILYQY